MDTARLKRQEDIKHALAFIQSPLAYPDPDGYQDFLTKLVCNLLEEGNDFFRDKEWEQAVREFTEGLNVACYAETTEVHVPEALLESLFVNRAAAHHSLGKYDEGVLDSDRALEVCPTSRRALYRKALCLKELGKFRESYDCITVCLLICPQDKQVSDLAQELTSHLGLKSRKPYVSSKAPADHLGNGLSSQQSAVPAASPALPQSSHTLSSPNHNTPAFSRLPDRLESLEDSELMGDDLDSLLDDFSTQPEQTEVAFPIPSSTLDAFTHPALSDLPAPTPKLPPAFFSSPISQLNALDSFSSEGLGASAATLDVLDDLSALRLGQASNAPAPAPAPAPAAALDALDSLDSLDTLDSLDDLLDAADGGVHEPETKFHPGEKSLDELLNEAHLKYTFPIPNGHAAAVPQVSSTALGHLNSLDTLDSFTPGDQRGGAPPAASHVGKSLDSISSFTAAGFPSSHSAAAPVTRAPQNHYNEKANNGTSAVCNPLFATHEFLQACSTCFPRQGVGIYSYVHKPNLAHNCARDVLLCRRKKKPPAEWVRVRPIPAWKSFIGPFVLCREVINSGKLGVCKYGEDCTFAYNQLEIDVWTEERKGTLDRSLLFETTAAKLDPVNNITRLLQENKGMFMFLCQECYDNKPRIISKRSRDNHTVCSNLDVHHNFDADKCLAFVVRTHNIIYKKVRPLNILCQMDLCRQAVRYGCGKEDTCQYAHSVIELKTWRVQRDTGITPDEIVKISDRFYEKLEQSSSKQKRNRLSGGGSENKPKGAGGGGGGEAGKNLDMNMKFVCAYCWRDGLISVPDKSLKHCSAKARHAWTKDRRVLLVKSVERSKWVQVRPLPHAKNFPPQYEICTQILTKKKCTFPGKCTFAHSPEERKMWMYMKNNDLFDMQQMYDMWLTLTVQKRQIDETQHFSEEKFIMMPTDYAEPLSGFHCRLCGRHSNGERQWQQHISSEKHKDRVFSCEGEDEAPMWSYRFPGRHFKLCPKSESKCPDGLSCDSAHSPEELQEWTERRDFLRKKLAKAREDMLIMPDEFDFGKYNFLLQD
ncbi:zinc finger CCCH domain-containing protein 7A-like [Salarias fasciatus]|uniref:Zinc finger CCCH domain-containing protein 7A-like n=1 Tax=Salarias fasciatus TaxID=181472 RepID=A0A672H0I5_SALFA|nr:zinc finger CCCH domain-containing protein 7A-like [Salarias fasciatus]XP_029946148.1 zinc finger CCCH domain-containing protein 7A-like [Salarias fasciatus]